MSLSLIITTYNRAPVLERLLRSLELQTDPNFEVVVAIDGSTDNTEEVLSRLKLSYPISWVNTNCSGYGLAVARNMGILQAKKELVVIIDDDCFPVPGFVASYKASARRKTITGGFRTPSDPSDDKQAWKMEQLRRLPVGESISFPAMRTQWPTAVATECNICMYRDDLIQMGLFSERLKIYGFIGQEFFARAEHFGFQYQFDPNAEIVHHRQSDGDNSLTFTRKRKEVRIAMALRTSLMNPQQYAVQVQWAHCMVAFFPKPCVLPPLPTSMWIAFPFRFMRNRAGDVKRYLRRRLRG
jgi:glycosyltransferase involved in cell wall biosynthesis